MFFSWRAFEPLLWLCENLCFGLQIQFPCLLAYLLYTYLGFVPNPSVTLFRETYTILTCLEKKNHRIIIKTINEIRKSLILWRLTIRSGFQINITMYHVTQSHHESHDVMLSVIIFHHVH